MNLALPRWLAQTVLVVAVLIVGAALAAALVLTKPEPKTKPRVVKGPLVDVMIAARSDAPMVVYGQGTVQAKTRSRIVPQVGGRVVSVHEHLLSGGFIPQGEAMLEIDATDYVLAASQAEAELTRADAEVESAEAAVADAQVRVRDALSDLTFLESLAQTSSTNEREVEKARVAHELAQAAERTAQAKLAAAHGAAQAAAVKAEQAIVNLERTRVTLPFDAVIIEETVDVGQTVTAGQSVGEAYGTSTVEIPVPLPDDELQWFEVIPTAQGVGSPQRRGELPIADIEAEFFGRRCTWTGRVVRTAGQVDPTTRMVKVMVEVHDPFVATDAKPPLIPGAFVDVAIRGRTVDDVVALPRYALRGLDAVWVVDEVKVDLGAAWRGLRLDLAGRIEGTLRIQPIQIVRRQRETVYVTGGLHDGAVVITSAIEGVTDGMRVRLPETAAPMLFADRTAPRRAARTTARAAAPEDGR